MEGEMTGDPRPSHAAQIEAEVKALGPQRPPQPPGEALQHREQLAPLIRTEVGRGADLPIGRDHEVPVVGGVPVEDDKDRLTAGDRVVLPTRP